MTERTLYARNQPVGDTASRMKFAQELRSFLDTRLVIMSASACLIGFGLAHWNGLRAAAESPYGGAFASLAYDIAFGQIVLAVILVVFGATAIVGFATKVKSYESRRLAVQLMITSMIFAALNLVFLAFKTSGA